MSPTVVALMSAGVPPVFLSALWIRPTWCRSHGPDSAAPSAPLLRTAVRALTMPFGVSPVAVDGGEAGGGGRLDRDRGLRAVKGDVAELSGGGELRAGRLGLDPGSGG